MQIESKMIEEDELKILSIKTDYSLNWHFIKSKLQFLNKSAIKKEKPDIIKISLMQKLKDKFKLKKSENDEKTEQLFDEVLKLKKDLINCDVILPIEKPKKNIRRKKI